MFKINADPAQKRLPPSAPAEVPAIDFSVLDAAASRLASSAASYDRAFSRAANDDFRLTDAQLARVNELLQGEEQALLSDRGLPGRPWYRHMLYAPGRYTGYGVKTLPAIREAVEQGRWSDARAYVPVVAGVLDTASARIDRAAAALAGGRLEIQQSLSTSLEN